MNIMPLYLAKLRLNLTLNTSLAIRTATAHLTQIDWQCLLDITIAGATATATVYCIPNLPDFLIRCSLDVSGLRCKAVGHYEIDTYIIKGLNDNLFLVPVYGT